ncbi:intradiol ring-cleavage dioxygenase [Curtobacterium sp. MCSS17_005]|uniref:intradiol ring-cleavage dioxygenase n=1 Tax=Curtobacterium sp. MCSS17_005 TaxID=2175641 RepID=UPI000DAA0029|nr:intradiol ring-cleavage dioxygenase [Curtobacterium sp. MCSS17_005]WIB34350.1 intradiol ring-cleavage dioxygenase [Curtobacterium sp. MCSS17_005]
MVRVPDPDQTPAGPAYEGRLLARPEDEVVDQGAGFDAKTLVTRRGALSLLGLGAGAFTLAACSAVTGGSSSSPSPSSTTSTSSGAAAQADGEIPEETNGPYPADGTNDLNVLEESGIVRSDITSSLDGGTTVDGVPLSLTFTVTDLVNDAAFAGAAVYVWQCDAQGLYSMYSEGVENETYLRGIQVADSSGKVTFQSIVPGCYTGRWTHIHFEVYPDVDSATSVTNVIATSQLALPAKMLTDIYALDSYSGSAKNLAGVGTSIADDDIFAEGDWSLQVPTITGTLNEGYAAALAVAIDTTTEADRGGTGSGQGGPGGAPGGTPPDGSPSDS